MIYTVRFTPLDDVNSNFAVFQDLEHAKDFIASRPDGYGKDYVIVERSEDGEHVKIVGGDESSGAWDSLVEVVSGGRKKK